VSLDDVAEKCLRRVPEFWRDRVKLPRPWQSNGCIAWRSTKAPKGRKPPAPEKVSGVFEAVPTAPLERVGDGLTEWGVDGELEDFVVFATADGRALAIDARYEPLLNGLQPMLIDSFPFQNNCAVAGVDEHGVVQVYVMEYRP
jgi:hypothetical protein